MNDPLGLFDTGSGGNDPLGLFSSTQSSKSPEIMDAYNKYSSAYDADTSIPIPGTPQKAPKKSIDEFEKDWYARHATLANIARAGVEQGANLLGGAVGTLAAPVASLARGISNLSQGKAPEFGKTYEESLGNFSSLGSQAAQALGQSNEFTQGVGSTVGDIMNNVIPMAAIHIPTAGGKLPGIKPVVAKDMAGIELPKQGGVESKVDALLSEKPADPLGLFEQKAPVEPGAGAFDKIVESQISGAQEPIRPYTTPMDFVKNQLEAQKQSDVQAVLDARNAEMQQQVARQTSLDMNAAERQRQLEAPVPGMAEAQQAELARQAAETDASIQKTQDLNNLGQQMSITEDYGNNDPMSRMPEMRVDENGIPIRADLSMEAQNLQDPLQMHLWGDELPNATGDGGVPLTQAIDSMKPGPERDQAIAQLANDIKSSADLDNAVRQANAFSGMRRGQAGAIDFQAISETVNRNANKLADAFDNFTLRLPKLNGKDETLSKLYESTVVTKPEAAANVLEAAKAAGDGPKLWNDLQSGFQMAADKVNNPMVKNAAQWFDWSRRKGDMGIRTLVRPIERTLGKLSKDEMVGLQKLIQAEMFERGRFDEARVQETLSPKAFEAYKQLRDTYDEMYKLQNEQRVQAGLPELSKQDAYMASIFHGDYHVAVRDSSGKLLWYSQNPTRAVANKAINFLKDYYKNHPDVDVSSIRQEFKAPGTNIPREMMGSWRNIIDALGDVPGIETLEAAYKAWVKGEGREFLGQNLHQVEKKMNVRGAAGDQPWLNAKDNAYNWAHAQIEYMQNTMRYLPMQEALDNVKTYLGDADLIKNQPNNMGLLRAYTANALGLNGRLTKAIESYMGQALGRSSNMPRNAVGGLKSATYAAMLWGSPGYWAATPIQALPASFSWFLMERNKGTIGTLAPKEFAGIMLDALQANIGKENLVKDAFNSKALKWAEDNQVVNSAMFDPESNLGRNKVLSRISKVGDATVSLPDTFSRRQLFLTFANAYKKGGMEDTAAFVRAGEQVEKIMVSMRREDRPIAVQKLGALGDAAWVFKAPVANMYNHLSIFAREAKKGNPAPLMAYLGSMALIGGVFALPFVNELDSLFEVVKDYAADKSPAVYDAIGHIPSPKEALLGSFPDNDVLGKVLNYGAVSAATGINMSTRFKNDIGDISNPLKSIQGPLMQEFKEWGSAADLVTNPGMNSVAQTMYQFAPGPVARGVLENTMPQFKSKVQPQDGSTNFKKPTDLHDPSMYINRDAFDKAARMAGVTSLKEAQYKDKNYLNNMISKRENTVRNAAFDRAWENIDSGNGAAVARNLRIFMEHGGNLGDALTAKAEKLGMDPQTYMRAHADNLAKLLDVQRRMEMDR